MKKSSLKYSFRLSLFIFLTYLAASLITFLIILLLVSFNVNVSKGGPLVLVGLVMVSCVLLAFLFTYIRTKRLGRDVDRINSFLDKIASGDFTCKLKISSKGEYLLEVANKLNIVSSELNSISILKSDFVRNFSHEFKTPISSIKGFSYLLYKDEGLSEIEKKKYLSIIYEESSRLASLADMTLKFSKMQSDNIVIDKTSFYVDEQIEECALQLANEVEKKQIEVEIDLSHEEIFASKELTKEIWLNLFSNAVKYSNNNGHIKIYDYKTNNGLCICFQDDGIGIGEEAKKHIFDEYYQEDPSRFNKGIGLGLALTKKIVSLHNWDIKVSSSPKEGSIFSVYINKEEK